jgi:hypothetical protein
MRVTIGVDSHKSTLAVAVLDELGKVVGSRESANDDRGHGALLEWIKVMTANASSGSKGPAASEPR